MPVGARRRSVDNRAMRACAGWASGAPPLNGRRPCVRSQTTRAVAALTVMLFGVCALLSAADPCDPRLVQPPTDPDGYRLRGDRCEGIFIRQVSGSASLLIASFTQGFAEFNPRQGGVLPLDWTPAAASKATKLRAYGLRRRQYYRMDTEQPPGTRVYRWPATVLGNLDISKRFLGVVAWNELEVGSQTRPVYLPLRIGTEPPRAGQHEYQLILVSDVELMEVFLSLAAVDVNGKAGRYLMKDRPLGYGYYPREEAIRIPLSNLDLAGLHRLEVAATQRDGGIRQRGGLVPARGSLRRRKASNRVARFFISYRREDAAAEAGRLYDLLSQEFGSEAVFMDVDTLQPGSNYRTVIERHLRQCQALLAVVGRSWLDIRDEGGHRRLDAANDLVRFEIEEALSRGVTVIPILVDNATVPAESSLPSSLRPLSQRQSIAISTPTFRRDAQKLLDILGALNRATRLPRWVNWRVAAVLVATALLSLILPLAHATSAPAELELRVSQFGFRLADKQPVIGGLSVERLGLTGLRDVTLPGKEPSAQSALLLDGSSAGRISVPALVLPAGASAWYQRGGVADEVQLDIQQPSFEFRASVEGTVRIGSPGAKAYTATFDVPAQATFTTDADVVGLAATLAASTPRVELVRQVKIDALIFQGVEHASLHGEPVIRSVSPIDGGTVTFWPGHGPRRELKAGDWLRFDSFDGQLRTVEFAGNVFTVRAAGTVRRMQTGPVDALSSAMPSYLEAAWLAYRVPFLVLATAYLAAAAFALARRPAHFR